MTGDPPLDQVVAKTWEAGIRGAGTSRVSWSVGYFHARNLNDILFVSSEQSGFEYFKNFGQTKRHGVEASAQTRAGRVTVGAAYTWLDATFESEETVSGAGNSTNDEALDGRPGLDGVIEIEPGNRIPLIPRHLFKAFVSAPLTSRLSVDVNVISASGGFARGNENNQHRADGLYYIGPGAYDGSGIVNAGVRFALTSRLDVIAQVNNLFDRRYATAAQLGPTGFTKDGNFIARPFPPIGTEFPVTHTTFDAPGAPRAYWVGVRVRP
jgi:outer membrane receptor protein involved in Fe transport